ncbi:MAG: threonine synthase [Rhodothalassiaceae bacterium]
MPEPASHSFVSHLECGLTGDRHGAGRIHNLSAAGRPLLVRYDLARAKAQLRRSDLTGEGLWRYAPLLPVTRADNRISLGEVMTPLIGLDRLGPTPGALWVKDESRLPTGSFKARGLALAVSMAKEFGITRMAMPTNGNAGAALAAYASRAGIESFVFCPDDTPEANVCEIALQGAKVWTVNGLINDCGKLVAAGKEAMGWFDVSTLKEPYRIEGKKTMGLELAEQLGWRLPDAIFYPTGGGTGLIGMWKAFHELKALGWIDGPLPKMIAVQSTGCAPIVKAWQDGTRHAELWQGARTVAAGIRVPVAVGDFLILDAVRDSGGWAEAVEDEAILEARDRAARSEGLLLCPEGAATLVAYEQALADGRIAADAQAVLFNCGSGLKYPLPNRAGTLDRTQPIDWHALARGEPPQAAA